jgi:hypothetical protein
MPQEQVVVAQAEQQTAQQEAQAAQAVRLLV